MFCLIFLILVVAVSCQTCRMVFVTSSKVTGSNLRDGDQGDIICKFLK